MAKRPADVRLRSSTFDRDQRNEHSTRKGHARHHPDSKFKAFPFEDPLETYRTMSAAQFKMSLMALDLIQRDVADMFHVNVGTVNNWANDVHAVPRGVADYLRLKVALRLRALAYSTGVPIMLDHDYETKPSDKALVAIQTLAKIIKEESGS